MIFLVTKKRTILYCIVALVIAIILMSALGITKTAVVYSGISPKKVPIYNVDTPEKKISISFDASWGADKTLDILSELEKNDIVGNFFCVGFWAEKYPDILKKLSDSGRMEIGTHSNTHPHMSKLNKKQIDLELTTSINSIKKITGKDISLFRAPYGDYNDTLLDIAKKNNLYTIQWDVDSLDWKGISAKEITNRVLSRTKNGSIILMHNDGAHTVEALPLIIAGLKNKGYTFVKISDLIYHDNYTIDHTGKQIHQERTVNENE